MNALPDGFVIVAKRDCPTCVMIEPVYRQIADQGSSLTVFSQDDPSFPESVSGVVDDRDLECSYRNDIETVPTLIRVERGKEVARVIGWHRGEWEDFTGLPALGPGLPDTQPGSLVATRCKGMHLPTARGVMVERHIR